MKKFIIVKNGENKPINPEQSKYLRISDTGEVEKLILDINIDYKVVPIWTKDEKYKVIWNQENYKLVGDPWKQFINRYFYRKNQKNKKIN